jgi:hypothetical protein
MPADFNNHFVAGIVGKHDLIITAEKKCERPVILFDGWFAFGIGESNNVTISFLNITGSNLKIDGKEATLNRERETGRNLN